MNTSAAIEPQGIALASQEAQSQKPTSQDSPGSHAETIGNRFVHAYLVAEDEKARDAAFDALIGYCWQAKGDLFVPVPREMLGVVVRFRLPSGAIGEKELTARDTWYSTREFIEVAALEYLAQFDGLSRGEIDALAAEGKLRHIGNRVSDRLKDQIDKVEVRADSPSEHPSSLSEPIEPESRVEIGELIQHDAAQGSSLDISAPQLSADEFAAVLVSVNNLEPKMGFQGTTVLRIALSQYSSGAFEDVRWIDVKGTLTRAIEKELGVGRQRATEIKKMAVETMNALFNEGDPDASRIINILHDPAKKAAAKRIILPILPTNQDSDESDSHEPDNSRDTDE